MIDFFRFEEKEFDFPFYNGMPKLSTKQWIGFVLVPISILFLISGILYFIPLMKFIPDAIYQTLYAAIPFIFLFYACKGNLGLFFKKPKLRDLKVIIICLILYYVYTIAMVMILVHLGVQITPNSMLNGGESSAVTLIQAIGACFQLLGEEFFKVSVLILAMALFYHFAKNRKGTIIFGSLVSMIIFGLVHLAAYGSWIHCILVIGVGSLIHLYPYLKTKNIVLTYILHLLIDLLPLFLTLIHI